MTIDREEVIEAAQRLVIAQASKTRSGIPKTRWVQRMNAEQVQEALTPAILLHAEPQEAPAAEPTSRIGGYPNALPIGGWPMVADKGEGWHDALPAPMTFVAQIELAAVSAALPPGMSLPNSGWLLFFLDEFYSAEGVAGDPYLRPCRVVHVREIDEPFGHRPPPLLKRPCWSHHEIVTGYDRAPDPGYAADAYPAARVHPRAGFALHQPGFDDAGWGLPRAWREAIETVLNGGHADVPRHHMFGPPACNKVAAVRTSDGAFVDYPMLLGALPDAEPGVIQPGAAPPPDPWIVLLKLESANVIGPDGERRRQMLWHDAGFLMFMIRRSALVRGEWSDVVAFVDG